MVALASKSVKTAQRSASPRSRQTGVVQQESRPLPPPQPFRFTVKDYYRLGEIGILKEDDRVELIQGEIVMMPPIDITHAQSTDRSFKSLFRSLGEKFDVRCQLPVRLGQVSEPVPDVSIVKAQSYRTNHPTAAETLLIVENSNTSLKDDLGRKKLMYASAGIPEYWVVDLNARVLHVFARPKGGDYLDHRIHEEKETVQSITLKPLKVKVAELLP
ncbi:MAG: Uma2 family endonuclease [Verrucomicrobiaceae bacterium]|nr:Uma2 family endonuclease [Verrucomicrobiaceae bacterium]